VGDTAAFVNECIDAGSQVLLEGTQGSGLSLTHGPWPYVTSSDTNAAQLAADAGIAPNMVETILVARTFPIRVAGQSGPLPGEMTWEQVGVAPERTTVTKKERRIGRWDWDVVFKAIRLNRPMGLALTFVDYWFPESRGCPEWEALPARAQERIRSLEKVLGIPILYVSTGPAGTPIVNVPLETRVAA